MQGVQRGLAGVPNPQMIMQDTLMAAAGAGHLFSNAGTSMGMGAYRAVGSVPRSGDGPPLTIPPSFTGKRTGLGT
jgi:hypothetical protein